MAGIYIHIPYCRQACHYCNFHFSVSWRNKDAFIRALLKEMQMQKNFFNGPDGGAAGRRDIETIYIGGGTPSVLEPSDLIRIFEQLGKYFHVDHPTEVTLEANPDDLTYEKLLSLRQLPVQRLSIGIQSFHLHDLQYMNRVHSPVQALESIRNSRKVGFDNITVDLIYGIPGMSDAMWRDNLRQVIEMGVPHISAYALTVEKKTVLEYLIRKGRVPAVSDEQCARQFDIMCDLMEKHGYQNYEISNFALPGHSSHHNLGYWTGIPYLGLGPSAHSYKNGQRFWNVSNTSQFIASIENDIIACDKETLTPEQVFNEYVMTSLRTMWGCDLEKVRTSWGDSWMSDLEKSASQFLNNGLMAEKNRCLVLTRKGKYFADGIAADLFVDIR